jgi:O-antigen ligase
MAQQQINYYIKTNWKEILFFIFLWLLLYIEPITIGPLKISQIWKFVVVAGMFGFLLTKKLPAYVWVGFLFAFKYLFYTKMPYGYLTAIQNALEAMIFPLFLGFFYIKFRNRPDATERLMHIAILLSLFFIFSAVPFMFGLNTFNPVTELDKYGIEGTATKGLFYHIAVSSKMFTIATIVLINAYKRFSNNFKNKIIWLSAVLLGTWFVYTSWTRTGWFIFLVALLISFFYNSSFKKKLVAVIVSVIIFIGIVWVYENNQAFRYRLTGGATYRTDTELSVEQLASSRLPFIMVAIDNLKDEGPLGQWFGYGAQHGIDLFKQKTGMSIVSHNGTTEILESSGILALILYFLFIKNLFKKVIRIWNKISNEVKKQSFISMVLFAGFFLSSHGTPFWGEIIFSCFFSSIIINNTQQLNIIKE